MELTIALHLSSKFSLNKLKSYNFGFDIFDLFKSVIQDDFLDFLVVAYSGDFIAIVKVFFLNLAQKSFILVSVIFKLFILLFFFSNDILHFGLKLTNLIIDSFLFFIACFFCILFRIFQKSDFVLKIVQFFNDSILLVSESYIIVLSFLNRKRDTLRSVSTCFFIV